MNIEKIANDLRSQLGYGGVDLLVLLRMRGIISDLGPDESNVLGDVAARWNKEDKSILIANDVWEKLETSEDGDVRFTIYHEIGHAVLNHPSRNRKSGGRPQFGRDIERHELEADDFALAFAIPADLIPRGANIAFLVRRFGLTEFMTGRRMASLKKGVRPSASAPWAGLPNSVQTEDEDWDF
jgi:Predicted Zn peptidase